MAFDPTQPESFDDKIQQAIEGSDIVPGEVARVVQRRLPTAPVNPSVREDNLGIPFVRLRAPHSETGNMDDISTSGNESDLENTVPTGLVKADAYTSLYERGADRWSRHRGNECFTLMPLAVRNTGTFLSQANSTVDGDTGRFTNFNARGAHFIINVTAVPGVVTITPTIQAYDEASGTWYDLLVGAAIVATGRTLLKVYPGIVPVPNLSASDCLPLNYRMSMAHSAAGNFTYSVGVNLVV